jgi:TonB-dependent SusC/RagA subfamily outer membrane receptor
MRKLLALLLAVGLFIGQLSAQTRTISGKITSQDGSPIPNASILIRGTSYGTTTNPDGTFTMNLPASGRILTVSAVGMAPAEVTIGNRTVVNVSLTTLNEQLQEVVVVGYGIQQKRAFTGAASKVDVKEFSNLIAPSIDKLLAGRATGVQVTNQSGLINQPARIFIRGVNSISQGQGPLIVVDGIPVISGNLANTTNSNALGDINPADIENMEVLKDGSATAIFGSRAAGGVIMITTKKGDRGCQQCAEKMETAECRRVCNDR